MEISQPLVSSSLLQYFYSLFYDIFQKKIATATCTMSRSSLLFLLPLLAAGLPQLDQHGRVNPAIPSHSSYESIRYEFLTVVTAMPLPPASLSSPASPLRQTNLDSLKVPSSLVLATRSITVKL